MFEESKKEEKSAKFLTKIEKLENEIKELDSAMNTDGMEYEELNGIYGRKLDLVKELDSVMALWIELEN